MKEAATVVGEVNRKRTNEQWNEIRRTNRKESTLLSFLSCRNQNLPERVNGTSALQIFFPFFQNGAQQANEAKQK